MALDPPSAHEAERALSAIGIVQTRAEHATEHITEVVDEREKEKIPKGEARVCKALGDGSCLFYCILGENDATKAGVLRGQLRAFAAFAATEKLGRSSSTVAEMLQHWGITVEGYGQMVQHPHCQGGEIELHLAANMLKMQLRVFTDQGDSWLEMAHYGVEGEVRRLLYTPDANGQCSHYDILQPKERWVQEQAMQAAERGRVEHKVQKAQERVGPKQKVAQREERMQANREQYEEQVKERRKRLTQESRDKGQESHNRQQHPDAGAQAILVNEEPATLDILTELNQGQKEQYCVCHKQYNNKEYYIQCSTCRGWFHPRCLGLTQAACEAERHSGGWKCGRPECADGSRQQGGTTKTQEEEGEALKEEGAQ